MKIIIVLICMIFTACSNATIKDSNTTYTPTETIRGASRFAYLGMNRSQISGFSDFDNDNRNQISMTNREFFYISIQAGNTLERFEIAENRAHDFQDSFNQQNLSRYSKESDHRFLVYIDMQNIEIGNSADMLAKAVKYSLTAVYGIGLVIPNANDISVNCEYVIRIFDTTRNRFIYNKESGFGELYRATGHKKVNLRQIRTFASREIVNSILRDTEEAIIFVDKKHK